MFNECKIQIFLWDSWLTFTFTKIIFTYMLGFFRLLFCQTTFRSLFSNSLSLTTLLAANARKRWGFFSLLGKFYFMKRSHLSTFSIKPLFLISMSSESLIFLFGNVAMVPYRSCSLSPASLSVLLVAQFPWLDHISLDVSSFTSKILR